MLNQFTGSQTFKPRLIGISEVQHRISRGKSWIYAKLKSGDFPKPIQMCASKSISWVETDIDDWIASQINASKGIPNIRATNQFNATGLE